MAFEWGTDEDKMDAHVSPGRDVLLVLIDVRKSIFDTSDQADTTWFQTCIEMLIRFLKSKIIANDNSLLGVCFFGTKKVKNINALDHVYEFQEIGYPSAQRIRQLTELMNPAFDFEDVFGSMETNEQVSLSNALWHCGLAFANAGLKKLDSQTVWILTNNEDPCLQSQDERERVKQQYANHMELQRTLNLFYMPPSGKSTFDLSRFYATMFYDASEGAAAAMDDSSKQPAYGIHTYQDMMEESLRKRFRKRRLTSLEWHITKTVALSVDLFALRVKQAKSTPLNLEADTNTPLQSTTKWLCDHTGTHLAPEQIKTYLDYGNGRVYLTKDDMLQLKRFDAAGIQLLGFEPSSVVRLHENVRPPYFIYPTEEGIKGSTVAFVALHRAMKAKDKVAVCRIIMRDSFAPRVAALVPQDEVYDEQGQVQPMGFNVVFLPFLDDIRQVCAEAQEKSSSEQVDAACKIIQSLTLAKMPGFQNPELQKHYASIQALALDEDELAFNDADDMTLPDDAAFSRKSVVAALSNFRDACGGDALTRDNAKRKAPAAAPKREKKVVKQDDGDEEDVGSVDEWKKLAAAGTLAKKTVAQLRAFLGVHNLNQNGRKADLLAAVMEFLQES
ncbi:Aste57867_10071 [Aphanomyces stellatus]|uniref:Aste57867_10071 protein n=1 Tax=Aphanomyces stellatus TaxID=120398 RepID=A0A485KPI3_9STRA|nr:hypothetical protein As57867_010032 [Aphanomyces stellatus]VFT86947.1 Aste57867_10071 [Aphanomyces stellatus]